VCKRRKPENIYKDTRVLQRSTNQQSKEITDAIPYKERDASTSRGNYKQKASALTSAIKKNLTLLVLKDEKE